MRIALWIVVACFAVAAVATLLSRDHGGDAASRGLGQVFGISLGLIALAGGGALALGRFGRGWLIVAAVILAFPLILILVFTVGKSFDEARNQQYSNDLHSGREDFRGQPELLALANAISQNDENAIRAAAKRVPNLQASGRDGKTLLYFAVDQALERPELVKAVEVLLSLGADPNYNNGQLASFAMWRASNSEVQLLRAMLNAGGDPNAPDFRGNPIIFGLWDMTYFEADRPARLRLLLDRGAEINSTLPEKSPLFPGYTILLFRTRLGPFEPAAYADALDLLKRDADPNRAAQDGMTLAKMLAAQRASFASEKTEPPPEFRALWEWLQSHDIIPKET